MGRALCVVSIYVLYTRESRMECVDTLTDRCRVDQTSVHPSTVVVCLESSLASTVAVRRPLRAVVSPPFNSAMSDQRMLGLLSITSRSISSTRSFSCSSPT